MNRILVPIDGSAHADRALRHALEHALALVKAGVTIELDLINVQTPIVYGEILAMVGEEQAKEYAMKAGARALAAAHQLLGDAGFPFHARVAIGEVAEVIAAHVQKHHITEVVMGTRGLGPVSGLVLGSVATKVIHLVDVPITLIK
jgi:nucleotide-binding universal stress UspA family protein